MNQPPDKELVSLKGAADKRALDQNRMDGQAA